jgi:hypothetical protein
MDSDPPRTTDVGDVNAAATSFERALQDAHGARGSGMEQRLDYPASEPPRSRAGTDDDPAAQHVPRPDTSPAARNHVFASMMRSDRVNKTSAHEGGAGGGGGDGTGGPFTRPDGPDAPVPVLICIAVAAAAVVIMLFAIKRRAA